MLALSALTIALFQLCITHIETASPSFAIVSLYTLPEPLDGKYEFLTGEPLKLRDEYCAIKGCVHLKRPYIGQIEQLSASYPERLAGCGYQSRHGFNEKLAAILNLMADPSVPSSIEWFWILDLDAFITNWSFDIEQFLQSVPDNKLLIASASYHKPYEGKKTIRTCSCFWDSEQQALSTLNAGVMLIRNSPDALEFLMKTMCAPFTSERQNIGLRVGLPWPSDFQWQQDDQMVINILMEQHYLETGDCRIELLPQRVLSAHFYIGATTAPCDCFKWHDGDFVLHAYQCKGTCADVALPEAFQHSKVAKVRHLAGQTNSQSCPVCEIKPPEPNALFSEWPRIHPTRLYKYRWEILAALASTVVLGYLVTRYFHTKRERTLSKSTLKYHQRQALIN